MNKYYVLGNPIEHSKSPQIHTLFAEQTGRSISYEKICVKRSHFAEQIHTLITAGMSGCNVTVPFKEEAWKLCHNVSDRATMAQAVNTLICTENLTLTGDNTDGQGLVTDLCHNHQIKLKNSRILIAGAGGAARGILKPLLDQKPDKIVISNRTLTKAERLAKKFNATAPVYSQSYQDLEAHTFDLIINATSTSLDNMMPAIPEMCLASDTVLYDLMYAQEPTAFLSWGKRLGLEKTIDGLGMLVEQAAESFFLWEGVRPETAKIMLQLQQYKSRA